MESYEFSEYEKEEQRYIIDQLSLEANLIHGRTDNLTFFNDRYPADLLIKSITNNKIPQKLRGLLIRILTNLYVDDGPFSFKKMERCFKAYEPQSLYSDTKNKHINNPFNEDLREDLLNYYKDYFSEFADYKKEIKNVKRFEIELIRCLKFMFNFEMVDFSEIEEKFEFIKHAFGFLCYILDRNTNRDYFNQLKSLDVISQKDAVIKDYNDSNPIQKSGFDLKYALLNKRDWKNSIYTELSKIKNNDSSQSMAISAEIFKEIIELFHFFIDQWQDYLMRNVVELFRKRVMNTSYKKHLDIDQNGFTKAVIDDLVKEFLSTIPVAQNFKCYLDFSLHSLNEKYESNEFRQYRKEIRKYKKDLDIHESFPVLLIDTFNLSQTNSLRQLTLTLIWRHFSESAELVRNIKKTTPIFSEKEWNFYCWINQTIKEFMEHTEKSSLWFKESEIENSQQCIASAKDSLESLYSALYYEFEVTVDKNKFEMVLTDKDEKHVNKLAQLVYSSSKVYDYLITFIVNNMKLLKKVRFTEENNQDLKIQNIKLLFKY